MKNIEEQLNILQKTTMNPEERGVVRGAIMSYMQENPQKSIVVRNREDERLQSRTSNVNNGLINKKNMTIAIIIALLLGGGTSFAAENALPGDILYPIKIHVNENVQELAAVSDEAEANVQAKLAMRRLGEAEKLAVEGRLTAETGASLGASFSEHSQKSKASLVKVGGKNNASVEAQTSGNFEVELKAHEQILAGIEVTSPGASVNLTRILGVVRADLNDVSGVRIGAEAKVFSGESDVKGSAEGALTAAENKIAEVRKFFESKKSKLNIKAQTEISARLNAAVAAVTEGKVKTEIKAYADAFALFRKAARDAQTANLFIATYQDLIVGGGTGLIPMPPEKICPEVEMLCLGDAPMGRGPNCEIICGGTTGDDTVIEPGTGGSGGGTICPMIYSPVCGVNGKTYGNSCVAGKVAIAHTGACPIGTGTGDGTVACAEDAKICSDGSSVVRTGPNCEFESCPAEQPKTGGACNTDSDCDEGFACLDISPVVHLGVQNLRCWKKGMPTPICLAPDTHISTPNGDVLVKDMKEGMSVWTVDKNGSKLGVTVKQTGRMLAPVGHKVMHIQTVDGHELFVSPGHKVADGREAGTIKTGDTLGSVKVILSELVPYRNDYTYDILPSGDTGMYFANGILLQSTLK